MRFTESTEISGKRDPVPGLISRVKAVTEPVSICQESTPCQEVIVARKARRSVSSNSASCGFDGRSGQISTAAVVMWMTSLATKNSSLWSKPYVSVEVEQSRSGFRSVQDTQANAVAMIAGTNMERLMALFSNLTPNGCLPDF